MKRFFTLLVFLCLSFSAMAAEKQIGESCNSDNSATDWDAIIQCSNGTMVHAPLILGAPSTATYASTDCDSAKAGMLQWSGSALLFCDGSSWTTLSGSSGSGTAGPSAFSFTDRTSVAANSTITSNAVTLSGFTGALSVACGTGCTDILRNGTSIGTSGGILSGDTIAIKQTSSSSASTTTTTDVTVGATTSGTWSVTTKALAVSSYAVGYCQNTLINTCGYSPTAVSYLNDGLTTSGSYFGQDYAAKISLTAAPTSSFTITVYHVSGSYLAFYYSTDGTTWTQTSSGYTTHPTPYTETIPAGYRYIGVATGASSQKIYEITVSF